MNMPTALDEGLPQVNANVTDRNREQTRRICELQGWTYDGDTALGKWEMTGEARVRQSVVDLPNGSFTLCQVVGMLETRGYSWFWGGWFLKQTGRDLMDARPHDLTAAMDALIKVLEAKL